MKIIPGIWLAMVLLISCSNKESTVSGILPPEKMKDVMWDMIRADQYISDFAIKDTNFDKDAETRKLYAEVFRIHHTDQSQFKKSLDHYSSSPDLFKTILDSLVSKRKEIYKPRNLQTDSALSPLPGKIKPDQ